jgi:O-antigen/teichoic acid export membrane protein
VIPFGSLAVANLVSVAWGIYRSGSASALVTVPRLRVLVRRGIPLLGASIIPAAGLFAASALVALLASADELGRAEAARVAARPLAVVIFGFALVVGPRMMEAGRAADRDDYVRYRRFAALGIVVVGLAYFVIGGWSHALNPLQALVPLAFVTAGLVAVRMAEVSVSALSSLPSAFLLGAEQNRFLLLVSAIATPVGLLVTAILASEIGAFALPVGVIAASLTAYPLLAHRVGERQDRGPGPSSALPSETAKSPELAAGERNP